eukprot:6720844-Pyramimonas_sp.AAC.2
MEEEAEEKREADDDKERKQKLKEDAYRKAQMAQSADWATGKTSDPVVILREEDEVRRTSREASPTRRAGGCVCLCVCLCVCVRARVSWGGAPTRAASAKTRVHSHDGPIRRRTRENILTTDQSDAGRARIFSRRIHQMQDAREYSNNGPIGRRTRGNVLTTDQSGTGGPVK